MQLINTGWGREENEATVWGIWNRAIDCRDGFAMEPYRAFLQVLMAAGCELIVWDTEAGELLWRSWSKAGEEFDVDFWAIGGCLATRFEDGQPEISKALNVKFLGAIPDGDLEQIVFRDNYLVLDRPLEVRVGAIKGESGLQDITDLVLPRIKQTCSLIVRGSHDGDPISLYGASDAAKDLIASAVSAAENALRRQLSFPSDAPVFEWTANHIAWNRLPSSLSRHATWQVITDFYDGLGGCGYEQNERWVRLTCTMRVSSDLKDRLLLSIPCESPAPFEEEVSDRFLDDWTTSLPIATEAFLIWTHLGQAHTVCRVKDETLAKIKAEMAERQPLIEAAGDYVSSLDAIAVWGPMERIW